MILQWLLHFFFKLIDQFRWQIAGRRNKENLALVSPQAQGSKLRQKSDRPHPLLPLLSQKSCSCQQSCQGGGGWYWWPSGIVETVERMSNPKLLLSRSRTHFPNWGKGEHPAFVYHLWNARNSIFRNLPQLFPFLHLGMNLKIEGAMMHKLRKIENITPHEQYYGYWSKLSFLIDSVIRRKKCEDSQNPHTCIDLR